MNNLTVTIGAAIFALASLSFLFMSVSALAAEDGSAIFTFKLDLALATRMAYVWTAVAAAVIIFALVGKYMGGGTLGRPIALMGVGAIINAAIGFIPILVSMTSNTVLSPSTELQFVFLGSLIFNISVLAGVFWIAKVFGVLMVR